MRCVFYWGVICTLKAKIFCYHREKQHTGRREAVQPCLDQTSSGRVVVLSRVVDYEVRLHSINTSLGSTSSICMGTSQGGNACRGTLRYTSRTGSFSGACDLSRVATSVGTTMLSSAHLSDITAVGQHSLTVAGVGGGVSVIGIGDIRNMGSLGMTGVAGQTMTSMLPSSSTRQPQQTMPGARDPSRTHSPQILSGLWDTRL
ncbi:hypothetical protein E2C01_070226 [Portunus trituberculatus]|uniref:Uncharacterized protein n=1 Tax=Portunus trituberculatus TaxID=210409 RepID=A0A5B7I4J1_PORTR|nr:hypothetical protein [Portunus trituberculatus]